MKENRLAVFIGRFQPFHNGHLQVIEHGLEIADDLLILVGSAESAPSPKNPWSYTDRIHMIWDSLTHEQQMRVTIRPLRDYYYNENAWLADIQRLVENEVRPGDPVVLVGSYKDKSSYYLRLFPQWEFSTAETVSLHGTELRNVLYAAVPNKLRDFEGKVPDAVRLSAKKWVRFRADIPKGTQDVLDCWIDSKAYGDMAAEYAYLKDYKAQWADSPFPPMFVTTDAVVTCAGHVLVVKRKVNPGKGLYALPGGFIKEDQLVVDSMLRELREETAIRVDKLILKSEIVAEKVFDHPDRSARGRTISHGFHIHLDWASLPEVTANDDAAEVHWMSLWDVVKNEHLFFEDHAHIISYFTTLGVQGGR